MKQENLKLNIIFNILSQIVLYITPLVIAPYISRTLGATGVGEYTYAYSILYYFNIFIIFGFSSYGTKQIARNRNNTEHRNSIFWNIIISRFILFVTISILFVCTVISGAFSRTADSAILIALLPVMISSAMDMTFFLQGVEKFRIISLIQVSINLLYMIFVFVFVKSYNDLLVYTVLKSSIGVGTALLQLFFIKKYISKPNVSYSEVITSIKGSFVYFLPTLLLTINPILDQTMLGALSNVKEVAYYEQTYKIISLVNMLVGAIAPVMLSRISFLYENNRIGECKNKIEEALHLGYFIIIPAMMGLLCVSKYFIPAYFGDEFIPAVSVMYILCISVVFAPISSIIVNSYFFPMHKEKIVICLTAVCILINCFTNFFAIKYLGANGAAITTCLLSISAFLGYLLMSKSFINYKKIFSSIKSVIFSSVIMAFCIILINKMFLLNITNSNIIVSLVDIAIGTVVYGVSIIAMKDEMALNTITIIKSKFLNRNNEK